MSKTIKVEDHVYAMLTDLQRGKETYSQTVQRILYVNRDLASFIEHIEKYRFSTMPRPGGEHEAKL
jgi:predicted CopG family antitoxin